MDNKVVMDVFKNEMIAKFEVIYMSYPVLNQNKAFTYQVEISISSTFDKKICFPFKQC